MKDLTLILEIHLHNPSLGKIKIDVSLSFGIFERSSKLRNMAVSMLIQKHFSKIAVGAGLGLSGALQYFAKIGER